ncbi:hypothetical protein M011DRAFT_156670 [Sporormia fimetaria CBS 119925]|uniref:Uncharacterized protein n=1 Tax=Sporormia fimetaria CBS 119925 TaxID=1340428 RepID=A0A6A6V2R0_9PLEO|nr:hypothetical protein M011DRAFT_156670 [Sporormia fimetaria CBS 119925]
MVCFGHDVEVLRIMTTEKDNPDAEMSDTDGTEYQDTESERALPSVEEFGTLPEKITNELGYIRDEVEKAWVNHPEDFISFNQATQMFECEADGCRRSIGGVLWWQSYERHFKISHLGWFEAVYGKTCDGLIENSTPKSRLQGCDSDSGDTTSSDDVGGFRLPRRQTHRAQIAQKDDESSSLDIGGFRLPKRASKAAEVIKPSRESHCLAGDDHSEHYENQQPGKAAPEGSAKAGAAPCWPQVNPWNDDGLQDVEGPRTQVIENDTEIGNEEAEGTEVHAKMAGSSGTQVPSDDPQSEDLVLPESSERFALLIELKADALAARDRYQVILAEYKAHRDKYTFQLRQWVEPQRHMKKFAELESAFGPIWLRRTQKITRCLKKAEEQYRKAKKRYKQAKQNRPLSPDFALNKSIRDNETGRQTRSRKRRQSAEDEVPSNQLSYNGLRKREKKRRINNWRGNTPGDADAELRYSSPSYRLSFSSPSPTSASGVQSLALFKHPLPETDEEGNERPDAGRELRLRKLDEAMDSHSASGTEEAGWHEERQKKVSKRFPRRQERYA